MIIVKNQKFLMSGGEDVQQDEEELSMWVRSLSPFLSRCLVRRNQQMDYGYYRRLDYERSGA